jgi:hypothetical protein
MKKGKIFGFWRVNLKSYVFLFCVILIRCSNCGKSGRKSEPAAKSGKESGDVRDTNNEILDFDFSLFCLLTSRLKENF